ncbi:hypothetical protein HYQ44_005755 [Verticillium longisporum]|nr:hypothetical protein HYQ44_005755 [Verticillium longisporum]
MCAEIACILNAHGWQRLVLVSHSYGSIVATHLIHAPQTAQKVGPILFVDPVAFLLHLPHVAYNFTYRKPTNANEHLLSYFGAKDIGISHTLFRRFFWAENILWKEDIQDHHRRSRLAAVPPYSRYVGTSPSRASPCSPVHSPAKDGSNRLGPTRKGSSPYHASRVALPRPPSTLTSQRGSPGSASCASCASCDARIVTRTDA